MATSKVTYTVTDGNLNQAIIGDDGVASLLFDVSVTPTDNVTTIGADGEVYQIFSIGEAEDLGILPYGDAAEYENGVPHKHIDDFFATNPSGELYIGLADMSSTFDMLSTVNNVAQGRIRQQGIYTRQELFVTGTPYSVDLVAAINTIAAADAALNRPYSVILSANVTTTNSGADDVVLAQIPTAIGSSNRVSLAIGQANDTLTKNIHKDNTGTASVGCVGTAIGITSLASVGESIGYVAKFDISGTIVTSAFGWGDKSSIDTVNTPYESLAPPQLDTLRSYGYIFPHKYDDVAGTYFSGEETLATGDYNSIARNRAIDKSRRLVRLALLPTIQESLSVDPETGKVSQATAARFTSIVQTQLAFMTAADEISGFSLLIDKNQDIITNNGISIDYRLIPKLTNNQIAVSVGFSATA